MHTHLWRACGRYYPFDLCMSDQKSHIRSASEWRLRLLTEMKHLFSSEVYNKQQSLINNPCALHVHLIMHANAPIRAKRRVTSGTPDTLLHESRALSLELLIATTFVCAHVDEQWCREMAKGLIGLGQL